MNISVAVFFGVIFFASSTALLFSATFLHWSNLAALRYIPNYELGFILVLVSSFASFTFFCWSIIIVSLFISWRGRTVCFHTVSYAASRRISSAGLHNEDFDMCINSMNSLSLSTTDEYRLIQLIQQPSNTIKDAFVHIGGKLAKLPNQRRDTVAREMIQIMKWRYTTKWRANIIMSPCHPSPSSSCHPTPPPICITPSSSHSSPPCVDHPPP